MVFWRGRGWLVPMLFFCSVLPMIPADRENLFPFQSAVFSWLVLAGISIAWFGIRSLLDAEGILGRPLAWWEWVFDPTFFGARPFHSFCFIQLPWWALAFAAAAFYWGRATFFGVPMATP